MWELWATATLPPHAKDFIQKVLWKKLPVHERAQRRSGTDKCLVWGKTEGVRHATVDCSMYKAVSAIIQHFHGPVTREDEETAIKEAVESVSQEWLLQSAQGLAIWSARQAHWRHQCAMKAGATPIFTSFLTTWLRVLSEWLPFFQGAHPGTSLVPWGRPCLSIEPAKPLRSWGRHTYTREHRHRLSRMRSHSKAQSSVTTSSTSLCLVVS